MKRVYDFDNLEGLSEVLGMDLELGCGCYIDRSSGDSVAECDTYFEWQLIQLLDELSDEQVETVLFRGN